MLRSRWPLLIPVLLVVPFGIYWWFTTLGPSNVFAVLAGTTLLAALTGLWWSVRGTLAAAEDAALDLNSDSAEREALLETKRTLLRALKDLEHERQVGKLDERDYERLSVQYRGRAKEVLAQLDQDLGPYLVKARELAGDEALHGRPYEAKASPKRKSQPAKKSDEREAENEADDEAENAADDEAQNEAENAENEADDDEADDDEAEDEADDNEGNAEDDEAEPEAKSKGPASTDLAAKLASLPEDKRKEAEAFLAKLTETDAEDES